MRFLVIGMPMEDLSYLQFYNTGSDLVAYKAKFQFLNVTKAQQLTVFCHKQTSSRSQL